MPNIIAKMALNFGEIEAPVSHLYVRLQVVEYFHDISEYTSHIGSFLELNPLDEFSGCVEYLFLTVLNSVFRIRNK